ncbi:MAG: VTC domain-containing protein [Kofleriaceae bacterium]|nr:VTC domain-containing protein [Kofleriaceae bacterium]
MSASVLHFTKASPQLLRTRDLLTRREEKFVLPLSAVPEFLSLMSTNYHLLAIGQSIPAEDYETVYFDSSDLQLYRRGLQTPPIHKVRLRRYGHRRLSFLEVKTKEENGDTSKVRMSHDYLSNTLRDIDLHFIYNAIGACHFQLSPQIIVQYKRMTFLSVASMERMTIDFSIRYLQDMRAISLQDSVVIEIKRTDTEQHSAAECWLRDKNIRKSPFSKFTAGLLLRGEPIPDSPLDLGLWHISRQEPK